MAAIDRSGPRKVKTKHGGNQETNKEPTWKKKKKKKKKKVADDADAKRKEKLGKENPVTTRCFGRVAVSSSNTKSSSNWVGSIKKRWRLRVKRNDEKWTEREAKRGWAAERVKRNQSEGGTRRQGEWEEKVDKRPSPNKWKLVGTRRKSRYKRTNNATQKKEIEEWADNEKRRENQEEEGE